MSTILHSTHRLRSLATILVTIALLPQASTFAQEPETFRPGFAWQPGLEIQASESRVGVMREGAVADSGLVSRATYRILVAEHRDGLLISHRDIRVERPGEFPADMQPVDRINVVVADNLKYWMRLPDLVVTSEGEFVRVDDLEAFQHRVDSSIRPVARALAGDDAEIMALLDEALEGVVNEEVITSLAADRWSSLVDKWASTFWEIGSVYETEIDAPNPLVPGPPIPYTVNAGVSAKTECAAPSGGVACAIFIMVTRPADSALGEAARLLADSLGAQMLAAAGRDPAQEAGTDSETALTFQELQLQARVELMTDPTSLLPVWLEERQLRRGRGTGLGQPFDFHMEEIVTTEFTYSEAR